VEPPPVVLPLPPVVLPLPPALFPLPLALPLPPPESLAPVAPEPVPAPVAAVAPDDGPAPVPLLPPSPDPVDPGGLSPVLEHEARKRRIPAEETVLAVHIARILY
jgi:hypothetical protein